MCIILALPYTLYILCDRWWISPQKNIKIPGVDKIRRAGRITSKDAVTARKGAVHLAKNTCDIHFKGGTILSDKAASKECCLKCG